MVTDGRVLTAIAMSPTDAQWHHARGREEMAHAASAATPTTALLRAMTAFETAVRWNPLSSASHQSLAWTYGQLARQSPHPSELSCRAARHFRHAIALDPRNGYRHRALASWLLTSRDLTRHEEGLSRYAIAARLTTELMTDALDAYLDHGRTLEEAAAALAGTTETDFQFWHAMTQRSGLGVASGFAEAYLPTFATNGLLNFWIADRSFYDDSLPWEFTERHYQRALALVPHNGFYRLWYGIHLQRRGHSDAALRELGAAQRLGLGHANHRLADEHIRACRHATHDDSHHAKVYIR